ncbi:MAG: hypothetical protein U0Z44_21530 [Kouleothrix sp.]
MRAYLRAIKAGAPASLQRNLAQAYLQAGDTHAARTPRGLYCRRPTRRHWRGTCSGGCACSRPTGPARCGRRAAGHATSAAQPDRLLLIDTLAAAGLRGRAREVADATIAVAPHDAAPRAARRAAAERRRDCRSPRRCAGRAHARRDLAAARLILARIQLVKAAMPPPTQPSRYQSADPRHADVVGPLLAEALEGCGDMAEALPYAERALARTRPTGAARACSPATAGNRSARARRGTAGRPA